MILPTSREIDVVQVKKFISECKDQFKCFRVECISVHLLERRVIGEAGVFSTLEFIYLIDSYIYFLLLCAV